MIVPRRISVFGSTGSIGQNTIALLQGQGGPEAYDVVAVTANQNIELLAEQAKSLRAEIAVTSDPKLHGKLREALAGTGIETASGPEAVSEAADRPTDWTMSSIVGAAGLVPSLRSLVHGGVLALANKESLVAAGKLILATATEHNARIIPVDSEHSGIFQAMQGEAQESVEKITLTASGGPFRTWEIERLEKVTVREAVEHPTWSMGQRISIDSATMFNKALEMIEAVELFGIHPDALDVVIHPQSIVHAIVEFQDGSYIAQMSHPDMRGAIGYALNWPNRAPLPLKRLNFADLGHLYFEAPDRRRFPALDMAREVLAVGGLAGAAFNAAKEAALDMFMAGKIGFLDMARSVRFVLDELSDGGELQTTALSLDEIIRVDRLARARAFRYSTA